MNEVVEKSVVPPVLKLNFISHGTLISKNLERTGKFYSEFLGFEVVRTSEVSLWTRLAGEITSFEFLDLPRSSQNILRQITRCNLTVLVQFGKRTGLNIFFPFQ